MGDKNICERCGERTFRNVSARVCRGCERNMETAVVEKARRWAHDRPAGGEKAIVDAVGELEKYGC